MHAFIKKLLPSLVAIAVIVSAFTGPVMTGTTAAQPATCPLDEDFSSWLPGGWTTDDWYQSDSKNAEGASPEARLDWDEISGNYAYLDSKPVYTTGAGSLTLEFKSFIDDYEGYYCHCYNCRVYTRAHEGDWWTDVTPWSNPVSGNIGAASYSIDISSDIGSATQVRFEFSGDSWYIDHWYVDDVKICGAGSGLPTHLKYLHAEDGLIDLGNPLDTQWHELWPFFCKEYHLSSWEDNGDGVLSRCDWIDIYEKPDGAVKPYHVEEVTITLAVTPTGNHAVDEVHLPLESPLGRELEPMYIELKGGYDPSVLTAPNSTQWHEVYPVFCQEYELIDWEETVLNETLDYCDYILLAPKGCYGPLTCPLDEDFSSWLPGGWTTDDWTQNSTNNAGGTSPEAVLIWDYIYDDYAYLQSKPVDTTGAPCLTLEFKSYIDDYCCSNGYWDPGCYYACPSYNCTVYTRAHAGDSWTDITPWSNPIYGNIGPDTYSVDISSDIGTGTQVRFEFEGYYYALDFWYLDDVSLCHPEPTWWHVEEVAIDIVVAPEPPPVGGEAYPVSKASLLIPWIAGAVILAGGISCYVLRRRRAQS